MAKRARPVQGNQSNKKWPVVRRIGGDNVNARGANRARAVNNNSKRRAT